MFCYQTYYRYYTLAKVGFGVAYLWFVWDFFRIHSAAWHQLGLLLSDPAEIIFTGNAALDALLRRAAVGLSGKAAVWIFLLVSPGVTGLFLWGRHRWLQFAVGGWMGFSLMALAALAGVFISTADIWLNYALLTYSLTALISPSAEWDHNEAGFSAAQWRENPVLTSTYAWLIVLLQFAVYLFAGVNKLVDGWTPWTTGVALQNLAFDSSMHEFVRGTHVPYWLSLILCYVTLFQRFIVPFGFWFRRCRLWSVLILGSMHVGYAILMYVNLFPLMGLASLLIILPVRTKTAAAKTTPRTRQPRLRWSTAVVGLFAVWLLAESSRLTMAAAWPWENKLMVVPAWRMFADGGVFAGGQWRLVFDTPQGKYDATALARQPLPRLWRDRFYIDVIFHDLLNQNAGPGSLVDRLLQTATTTYRDEQVQAQRDPTIDRPAFELYSDKPAMK